MKDTVRLAPYIQLTKDTVSLRVERAGRKRRMRQKKKAMGK